jgi:hypothetical protein
MSNFLNLKGLLAASLIFFVSFSNAEDATSGTLEATVLDQSGTAVAGASVSVTSAGTGISKSSVSSADGSVRFPLLAIGMYDVEVSASGFSSLADSVQVALGNSGYNFVLESASGSMEEIVTTAGAIQALDFNSTTTGISINVDELIANTPINRSLTSLVLLAPGTSAGDSAFGSLASIGGSSVAENVYLVNGLNITNFRNFTGSSSVPFEFYDVVEVKTGGYQAEFGKAIGGVVNAVTKSGSNEWKAGVNLSYYPDSFYHDKPNTYSALNDQDTRDYMEYNVSVSGPIIPDRAFFYILANPVDNQTSDTAISGNRTDRNLKEDFFGAKLDFYITEDIHLEYTYFNDDSMGEDLSYDSTGTQIGTSFNNVGGDNEILKLSAVITDRLTAAATMGKNTYERTVAGTGDACPWVWWPYPTNRPGCATSGIVSSGTDEREIFKFDVDYYIGNHHLRFGIENEDLTASDTSEYSGGVYYRGYDNDGDGTIEAGEDVRVRIYRSGGTFDVTQEAFYVQDSWDVTDKLNVNLGFRRSTFDNKNAGGETFVRTEDQDAIRIGATYDIVGDGSKKLYYSFGEYYLPIAANTNIRMSGGEFFTQTFCTWDGTNDNGRFKTVGYTDCGETSVFGDGSVPDTRSLTDANLQPMFGEETIIGYTQVLESGAFAGWDLNAYYVQRELATTIEDVAIDAAVNAWCAAGNGDPVGCAAFTGFHQYVVTNPGNDMNVYLPEFDQFVTLSAADLNYPKPIREYDGMTVELERVWDGDWALRLAYTNSDTIGNYEGTVKSDNGQDDAGITQDFDQPGLVDGSYGKLPNHRKHIFKANGSKMLAENLVGGMNMSVTSPRYYGCIGEHPTYVYAADYCDSSLYFYGDLKPRCYQSLSAWIIQLDALLAWNPPVANGDLTLRMDVFNILDLDGITDINEYGEDGGGVGSLDSNYLRPTNYQTARRIRFGASWRF